MGTPVGSPDETVKFRAELNRHTYLGNIGRAERTGGGVAMILMSEVTGCRWTLHLLVYFYFRGNPANWPTEVVRGERGGGTDLLDYCANREASLCPVPTTLV